jgi:D-sedoheptulose 7-phosphate isomerase
MSMLEQRIQQQFFESADLQYQAAEVLGRPIEQAVAALVGALTSGGRVLVAGLGASASLAQLMATQLISGFERDRPGLAAMALGRPWPRPVGLTRCCRARSIPWASRVICCC